MGTYDIFNCSVFNQNVAPFDNASSNFYEYIEAHNTIGVKRPDLYELGRQLSASAEGYELRDNYFLNNSTRNASGLMYTSIPWEKVQDLKNLVDAQHTYPELFNTEFMTADFELYDTQYLIPNSPVGRSGFLHIKSTF